MSATRAIEGRMFPLGDLPEGEESLWSAVLARDAARDGSFVYAVRTTGVYCRPSCPSRRPRRENVAFFRSGAQAEQAGFRACRRCGHGAAGSASAEAVARAAAYLEVHLDGRVTLAALARHVGLSPFHLQRTFRRALGLSPRAFQDAKRLARFKARVRQGEAVGMATYEAGYGSSRGLYESARAGLGMTPATYRRGGAGETIRYTLVATELGRLLVATTGRGVCSVCVGADDARLEAELRAEFPSAAFSRDDEHVKPWVEAVLRHVRDAGAIPPLDLRGTAFQLRVWQALREIPAGETRSYGDVARAIGMPLASRAVARACATNRLALVVPCHRVVRGDGAPGGYRWGPSVKRKLLDREAEHTKA